MKASLTFKTAVIAVATTAFAFSAPASAHDTGYAHSHQQSSNGADQFVGAIIGGVAGAAIGDGIAGRGQSKELGILGGLLGGVAGAAIAGGGSNGSKTQRPTQNGYYNTQNGYYGGYQQPRQTYGGNYGYQTQGYSNPGYTTQSYQTQGYYRPAYQQPYYPQTTYPTRTYTTTTYQQVAPYYAPRVSSPYYRAPSTSLTINLGSNGGYYNRGRSYSNHHNQRRRTTRRHSHYGH